MSKRLSRVAKWVGCVALAGAFAKPVMASIDYGDFTAANYQFLQVTEGSVTSTPPLYGAPTVAGNALVFNPVNFGATASNGAVQITDGTLTTKITALAGSTIDQLGVTEAGDYTLAGAPASLGTNVSVAAPIFLQIIQVNGVGINPVNVDANVVFTPDAGSYNLLNNPGSGVIWTGSLNVNIDSALAAAGVSGQATEVIYTMDNDLTAISQAGTIAFIQKKTVGGVIITPSVPEPVSTSWIALSALALLKRRRGC